MRPQMLYICLLWTFTLAALPDCAPAGLEVTSLGKLAPDLPGGVETGDKPGKWQVVCKKIPFDHNRVVIKQVFCNTAGNTSVRNASPLQWKVQGYFLRNRDLGQVFTPEQSFTLDAIVLRTGPADLAFLSGCAGAPVFIQFFEVTGAPAIDDNNTPPGTDAAHGFSKNHRCDDFIRGVQYHSLRVVTGGVMPDLAADGDGRLTYMKWDLTGEDEIRFESGKRYAFLVGFTESGPQRGFTLANRNNAHISAPPSLTGNADGYPGGWAIRREGNGRVPPMVVPAEQPPADTNLLEKLQEESYFPDFDARLAIPPTTDGYPDVDTYRDHEFYLLARDPA